MVSKPRLFKQLNRNHLLRLYFRNIFDDFLTSLTEAVWKKMFLASSIYFLFPSSKCFKYLTFFTGYFGYIYFFLKYTFLRISSCHYKRTASKRTHNNVKIHNSKENSKRNIWKLFATQMMQTLYIKNMTKCLTINEINFSIE